jgi:hypothetical protein
MNIDEISQLYPLGDLILNYGLDILFLLLSAVLLLNVFRWAAAEVVCPVFFRDNISISAPGTADYSSKSPDFCLYIRLLNSIYPGLQLLSFLLKYSNIWIGREYGQNIIRDMNRGTGIIYKTYIYQYIEDAVYREILENGRLDIEPYLLINIGPIIYSRVRIVLYNLVPNGISSST